MSGAVECPLCRSLVPGSGALDAHLRAELNYAAWRCRLCSVKFSAFPAAERHFSRDFGRHPGSPLDVLEDLDQAMETRLRGLLKRAEARRPPPVLDVDHSAKAPDGPPKEEPPNPAPLDTSAHSKASANSASLASRPPSYASETPKVELVEPLVEREPVAVVEVEAEPVITLDDDEEEPKILPPANLLHLPPVLTPQGLFAVQPSLPQPPALLLPGQPIELGRKNRARPAARCRECGARVSQQQWLDHVTRQHLAKVTFACKRCPYSNNGWYPTVIKSHCKRSHGEAGAFEDLRGPMKAQVYAHAAQLFKAAD